LILFGVLSLSISEKNVWVVPGLGGIICSGLAGKVAQRFVGFENMALLVGEGGHAEVPLDTIPQIHSLSLFYFL
jgi:hypothetical protein